VLPVATEESNDEIREMQKQARNGNESIECKGLPQKVALRLHTWELYVINRYWGKQSIRFLQGSGLVEYWDKKAGYKV